MNEKKPGKQMLNRGNVFKKKNFNLIQTKTANKKWCSLCLFVCVWLHETGIEQEKKKKIHINNF